MLKNDRNISKKSTKVGSLHALIQVARPATKKVNDKDTRIQIPISSEKKINLLLITVDQKSTLAFVLIKIKNF